MRSYRELAFRLRQEVGNLRLLAWKPTLSEDIQAPAPLAGLPDPEPIVQRLRGGETARSIEVLAEQILGHDFPALGYLLKTGSSIEWRRDYLHQAISDSRYFRLIPYLEFSRVGDHKVIWELNRHQHLVLLAQAFRLTQRPGFFDEIIRQLESWLADNPYLRGINWASALEVAFRALSWIWVYHLTAESMTAPFRRRFLIELYRHGCYLERNLSIYFSPNTHLLGEAVALHALGALFPAFPRAARWRQTGGKIVAGQMEAQVRQDGSHFEQSTYYHVYALDLFLFHRAIAEVSGDFTDKLERMLAYLAAVMGPARLLPFFGDDDGGRLFHPYGPREQFGRATLATGGWGGEAADREVQALWWLKERTAGVSVGGRGELRSCLFAQAGMAVMVCGDLHVVIKAGPFGAGTGGHSHADLLSLTVRLRDRELLLDPGTYTYVTDATWRDWFRGTAAHNTISIDGRGQATPAGPFRWATMPETEILEWNSSPESDYLDAICRYRGLSHRRRILLLKPDLLLILDCVDGSEGEHLIEQFWHAAENDERLIFPEPAEAIEAWRSRVFGHKEPSPALRVRRRCRLPAIFAALLDCSPGPGGFALEMQRQDERITLRFAGRRSGTVIFEKLGIQIG